MPSLPVTGIGKIFKPALQQREIEAVVRSEAQNVGATIVDLTFERSPRLGQVVRIRPAKGPRLCARLWSAMPLNSKCRTSAAGGVFDEDRRLDCPETSGRRQDGDECDRCHPGVSRAEQWLRGPTGFPPKPAAGEIEVAVAAASVNPIDVQRAQGYGRRLLSLVGAGRFPMVLGNDFAGTVTALGDMSTRSRSAIGSMA